MKSRKSLQWISDQRGNVVIEFALAFSLLTPVFVGSYEFGYAFYVYNRLETAVRAGARYASLLTYDSTTPTPSEHYVTAVRNMVVDGDPAGGAEPVTADLTPDEVTVTVTFDGGAPRWVTVGLGDYATGAVVRTLSFKKKPGIRMRYMGRFAPS